MFNKLSLGQKMVLGISLVLFVVLAIDVLHQGPAWAGYLNMAFGIGSVLASGVTEMSTCGPGCVR